ncbi:MAG: hypothetical protein EBS85_04785 [Micrococcales bacterium]|jgi:hypothetical protein|nr:hypothetical protein [Actinomycetota bacterium]NCA08026.1 hypothetical protein [Micrococcales bacterium]
METLAYLVFGLLLAQLGLGMLAMLLAWFYRIRGTFALSSQILIAVLALETIWAFGISTAFGVPAAVFVITAALIRYLPKK